ncbi:hypothetical protein [Bacillus cereus]|uniref:hypothetical protein n=1 Tax=Bacillus cereus TaxID=1396 RepID=UPI00218052C7|nr:hypothetical protein [Bacillus cereus]UWJ21247.1 hypothetical protein FORC10_p007 [Bacillus cereus]
MTKEEQVNLKLTSIYRELYEKKQHYMVEDVDNVEGFVEWMFKHDVDWKWSLNLETEN